MVQPTNPKTAEAFEAQVLPLQSWLLKRAVRLCRSKPEASDLVQDALERAWRSFGTLRPNSNIQAWLLRIVRNLAIDHHRRDTRRSHEPLDPDTLAASEAGHPTTRAGDDLSTEQLRRALATLPTSQQIVLEMRAVDCLSYEDISVSLGIPVCTVGSRLFRARERLRILLDETGPNEDSPVQEESAPPLHTRGVCRAEWAKISSTPPGPTSSVLAPSLGGTSPPRLSS